MLTVQLVASFTSTRFLWIRNLLLNFLWPFFPLKKWFRTGVVCKPATVQWLLPEFSGDRNYQRHHKCTRLLIHCGPISRGSVWKRGCAHSLALWDVATPAPNWSLSLQSRLQILICICHICRKERHSGERTMSQKTGHWHKLSSLRFVHDRVHLLGSVDSQIEKMLDKNISNAARSTQF